MTAAKRILMLLDNPLKSDSRVEREMKALAEAGHHITILATNEDPSLPVEEETAFYRVIRRMNTGFKAPYRKVYKAKNEETIALILGLSFEVLHCHDYHMLILGAAVKQRLPGIMLLYDAHEYLRGAPAYQESKGLANKVKAFIVWRRALRDELKAIQAADKIVTITNGIAAKMRDDFRLATAPVVVRNIPPKIPFIRHEHYFHDHFRIEREKSTAEVPPIADLNGLLDEGMRLELGLDLYRRHVLSSARLHQLLFASRNAQIAIGVERTKVTCMKPPGGVEGLGGCSRTIQVAGGNVPAFRKHFTISSNMQSDPVECLPNGADADAARSVRAQAGAGLRQPIGFQQRKPEAKKELVHVTAQRR